MSHTKASTLEGIGINKLIVGFFVTVALALAGTTSVSATQHTKDDCKNGGWQTLQFRNQGQCVSAAAKAMNGNGYGGGNNVSTNTNVNFSVSGLGHQVSVVVNNIYNFFF